MYGSSSFKSTSFTISDKEKRFTVSDVEPEHCKLYPISTMNGVDMSFNEWCGYKLQPGWERLYLNFNEIERG